MNLTRNTYIKIGLGAIFLLGIFLYRMWLKKAKNFDLTKLEISNLQGESVDLSKFKGKTIFISFWATWCKDCLIELPGIEKAKEIFKDNDIVFLQISDEEPKKIQEFINKKNIKSGFYHLNTSSKKIGIYYYPTVYVINKKGEIIFKETEGGRDWGSPENTTLLKTLAKK